MNEIHKLNIGIIGGGQLGKMILSESNRMSLKTSVLDSNKNSPCKYLTHNFFVGYKTNQDKSKHELRLQYPSYSLRLDTVKNIHHIKMSISIIAGSTSIQKKQKQLQELQKVRS